MFRGLRTMIGFGAMLFVGAGACGQVDRSGLSGTVTDASGRLLPQVQVTVISNATGLNRQAISDGHGNYSVPFLPVGIYTVTFERQGF
ncbi:MAG: carboxypeptidase-like regulatory domain-containing protein, partial [Acidobacteriaceae bacterium]